MDSFRISVFTVNEHTTNRELLTVQYRMSETLHEVRRTKLARLRAAGDAYPNDFHRTHLNDEVRNAYAATSSEDLAAKPPTVAVAGRLMLHRRMGKAAFFSLQDMSGRLQVYAGNKTIGNDAFTATDDWDIGDIIACKGVVFKTKTGELTIRAQSMRLLVKSLHPPPDKYHGLADAETRYRRRYVSLFANPKERDIFITRAAAIRFIRDFFHQRGYFEAETPILQPIPGGAAAKPFVSHCHALSTDLYLRIAQELYLKRLIVGGFERVFEINRNFRNEGISPRHNPEFTMLEFNAAYQNCEDFISLTEELLHSLVVHLTGSDNIRYQGTDLSFKRPFARLSPTAAILKQHPDIRCEDLQNRDFLLARLNEHEGEKTQSATNLPIESMQLLLFEKIAEHGLIQPTFLVDYPAKNSPLAKQRLDAPDKADRFELFIAGRELVNGFSEQNDPDLQAAVFSEQAAQKAAGDEEAMHYDADYIHALECGLPPNAGGGIGIDRLVMLLSDQASIRDVILFPQLRRQE